MIEKRAVRLYQGIPPEYYGRTEGIVGVLEGITRGADALARKFGSSVGLLYCADFSQHIQIPAKLALEFGLAVPESDLERLTEISSVYGTDPVDVTLKVLRAQKDLVTDILSVHFAESFWKPNDMDPSEDGVHYQFDAVIDLYKILARSRNAHLSFDAETAKVVQARSPKVDELY